MKYLSIKFRIVLTVLLLVFFAEHVSSCTTAIISGKYTKDGRPVLYKHRDTWAVNNIISYFDAKPYSFMGLVNSKDSLRKSVWIGMNDEGFSIMNSASYNLNNRDTTKLSGYEGRIMKQALQYCKTIEDFKTMLDTIARPTGLEANFGVIDAFGGAAYFELGHQNYTMIDANDPTVAPNGYLIRTNFSFTGEMGIGGGYIRYQTASDLFYEAVSTNQLDAQYILQNVSRSLRHSLTGTDLKDFENLPEGKPKYMHFRDFIPRTGSASSVAVQGVKKGENPDYTTMWSVVGFPLTSVVVPTWIKGGANLPAIVSYSKDLNDSPICHAALQMKKDCLPVRFGKSEWYYINVNALYNSANTGYMQKLKPLDNKLFAETKQKLEVWRDDKITKSAVQDYYKWLDQTIKQSYLEILNYTF